ncbi:hypothetical protein JCM4914_75820 [Streptomyces platensis subsp. malvinus]
MSLPHALLSVYPPSHETPPHHEPFYERQGFTVLEPGESAYVGYVLTGRPIGMGAGPGEQFFLRWRRN